MAERWFPRGHPKGPLKLTCTICKRPSRRAICRACKKKIFKEK